MSILESGSDFGSASLRFDWNDLPLLTPQQPGTGGRIRQSPEDFRVFEMPLYLPSGTGDFTYVHLEKTGHNTRFLLEELARQLEFDFKHLGVAGLKDRHAVTRQWISFPVRFESRLERFSLEGVRVLEVSRHANRLGIGHLQGNRFEVRVRGAAGQAEQAAQTLQMTLQQGLPNYFGPQRFGLDQRNAEEGLRLVRNNMKGKANIHVKRFLVSALQSLVFNTFLARRLERGIFAAMITGDMAKKHDTGGVFQVEDAPLESLRAMRGEVSALGTLPGRKVKPMNLEAGALEAEVLAALGLTWEDFSSRLGDRRLTRVFLKNAHVTAQEDGYEIGFDLPKGSFATSVLREVLKTEVDVGEDLEPEQGEEKSD